MCFNETIERIKKFYTKYDEVNNEIDNLFEKIDENEGDINWKLNDIYKCLYQLWLNFSDVVNQEQATIIDDNFKIIINKLNNINNYNEISQELYREIQMLFRNYSAVDSKPVIHSSAHIVIDKLFDIISKIVDNGAKFIAIKILYELVMDNLIIRCGISQLYKWNYGTNDYASLTTEEQLIIILNQSIMIDRLHGGQYLLKTYLVRLNKLLDSFSQVHWFVYYVAGFLNFKIHNYRESEKFFIKVENNKNLLYSIDSKTRNRYFHSMLLIAYGYEYAGDFARAIQKIVKNIDEIFLMLNNLEIKYFENEENLITFLNSLKDKSDENSLFKKYFTNMNINNDIFNYNNNNLSKIYIEILHALAHCINEYSIQNYSNDASNCAKLIRFARSLLKFIAKNNSEYWTCYATIHGEYKDYHKALLELDNAKNNIMEGKNYVKETLSAEIDFFKYYFGQMVHNQVEEEKNKFSSYCRRYSDDDALCHLQIFEFRSLLRDYLYKFFETLLQKNRSMDKIENLPDTSEIDSAYKEICKLHPSPYININVRAELRLMQRIYSVIIRLRKYLLFPSEYNSLNLINACKRYFSTKKELGLSDNTSFPNCSEEVISVIPKEVYATLFGEAGIIHSLYASDSVFVLAPISGVVVYQYQTGTIDNLFDKDLLLLNINKSVRNYKLYNQTQEIVHKFNKVISEEKQIKMINVKREVFEVHKVKKIFVWSSDNPFRLLQYDGINTMSRCLTDYRLFKESIDQKISKSNDLCLKGGNRRCKIYFLQLPWLEFVKEIEDKNEFLVYKKNIDGTSRYVILTGAFQNNHFCQLHKFLDEIQLIDITNNLSNAQNNNINVELVINSVDNILNEIKRLLEEKKEITSLVEDKKNSLKYYDDNMTKNDIKKEINSLEKKLVEKEKILSDKINELFKKSPKEEAQKYCNALNIPFKNYINEL